MCLTFLIHRIMNIVGSIFSPFSFQQIHVTFFFYIFAKGLVNQKQYNLNSFRFIAKITLV